MKTDRFNIEEALGFGWRTMTGKFGTLFMYVLVPWIAFVILNLIVHFALGLNKGGVPTDMGSIAKMGFVSIFQYVFQLVLTLGMLRIGLRLVNDEQPQWSDYAQPIGSYVAYFLASIVFGLMIFFGTLLLIIPGILWFIQFHYYVYAIVDKGMGPMEALKRSSQLTAGTKWKLFLFGLINLVINVAGFLCLIVGMIPASIVTFIASMHVYKQLCQSADGAEPADRLVTPA